MEEKKEKMSYEQLENVAHQLSEQVKQLYARLQEAELTNAFKRLDYLFKVVENGEAFTKSFGKECANEIKRVLNIGAEESEEK